MTFDKKALEKMVLEMFIKYDIWMKHDDGMVSARKTAVDFLTAKYMARGVTNKYDAIRDGILAWCRDTDATNSEKYMMIEAITGRICMDRPELEPELLRDRAVAHAKIGLSDKDLVIAAAIVNKERVMKEAGR